MTDRKTASSITDAELEQLYDERDKGRQSAAAISAQRDRLRQRMNTLADRWNLEGPPPGNRPLTELRAEISCAPFDPDSCLAVQPYRDERNRQRWSFRCWGTDTCDGWLGLGHETETSAQAERERHIAAEHPAEHPATERARIEAAIVRVRHLHRPVGVVAAAEAGIEPDCAACHRAWPCQTYTAVTELDEPKEPTP